MEKKQLYDKRFAEWTYFIYEHYFVLYTVHTNQDVANVCPRRQILVNREVVWGHVEFKVGMKTDYNRNCSAATLTKHWYNTVS